VAGKQDLREQEERCFIATQRFLRRGGVESPAGWCMHAAVAMRECLTRAGVDAELVARKLPRGAGGHWTVKTASGELDPTIGFWSRRGDSLYQIPPRPADAVPGQLYRVGKGSPQKRWRRVQESTARSYACVLPRIRPRKPLDGASIRRRRRR
jgi:hypothetical protein